MIKEFKTTISSITDRNDICVADYLRDISRYSPLAPEEEAELSHLIKKGGKEGEKAKERLIKANLRFVISVANRYKTRNTELADLISEGNIGLVKAAQLFDETRGFKFISYAVWWIRQSIITAVNNYGPTLHLPSNQQRMLQTYHRLNKEMMQLEHRAITVEEFCEATGVSRSVALATISANTAPMKMDSPIESDSDSTFGDMIASDVKTDASLDHESLCEDLSDIISHCLREREAEILCRYYGLGCEPATLDAIAESYNLSRERTRQICLQAITKLRQSPYSNVLADYLAA